MSNFKCQYCGSTEKRLKRYDAAGNVLVEAVTHDPVTTPCCEKQKRNAEYLEKRFHPIYGNAPKDVSEL